MKGRSEGKVREALSTIEDALVYKPPDDARNRKPADFIVLWEGRAALVEVKECRNLGTWPLAELRPSQRLAIRQAQRAGVPYYLVVWWPKRGAWSISDATKVLAMGERSIAFATLAGKLGIDADSASLPSILRLVILEGLA